MELNLKSLILLQLICYCCGSLFSKSKDAGLDKSCFETIDSATLELANASLHRDDPEITMTTAEIIRNRGYPVEVYHVTTDDGYILELVRIPYSAKENNDSNKTSKHPIYIQHGLMQDSTCTVLNPNAHAIAFWFVDHGYDVFVGSARGTTPSRNHTTLNPDKPGDFWDYTFHEKGANDVPAFIDKILSITGKSQLTYIGHSEGTTDFFVAASMKPEINKKIMVMFALGPATVISNIKPTTKLLCGAVTLTQQIPKSGNMEFKVSSELTNGLAKLVCGKSAVGNLLCQTISFAIMGFNYNNTVKESLASLLAHSNQGISAKELQHFCQSTVSKKFTQFNYGASNYAHYRSLSPPAYDLSNIKTKVYLFCGSCDVVTTPGDCKDLASKLSNVTRIEVPLYNHADYLFANNNDQQIFTKINEELKKFLS